MRKSILSAALAASVLMLGALASGGSGAHAAAGGSGPNSFSFSGDCGFGSIETVINVRAGHFAAAHIVGGGTFVPTAFGEVTQVISGPGGTQTTVYPADTKGSSAKGGNDVVDCPFDFTITDPASGTTFHNSGTVSGMVRPGKGG